MPTMVEIARQFFEACETGKGWEVCREYCKPDASFSAQSEVLEGVTTLQAYTDWMAGLFEALPNGSYELRSFAVDESTATVCAFAVFTGTHTGTGGPQPPTGKTTNADYVYIMQFEGDLIGEMTKVWNSPWTLRELGWA